MSQSRCRKAPAVGSEAGLRVRPSHTKASGDTVTPHPQHQNQRSKSKSKSSKVPKALRYDLENALVGLCNVWFEDIKPHLVQNNIKVHVHGGDAGAGDNRPDQLPPGAPGCSHHDPGAASDQQRRPSASSAGCCSTRQTASRAQYRKPRAPPFPPPSLKCSTLRRQQTQVQPYPNHGGRTSVKERVRQATSPSPPRSEFIGLVPRPSHTYSNPSTTSIAKPTSNNGTRPKRNSKKKKIKKENKATQTEHISQRRLSVIPLNATKSQKHFHKSRATTTFYPPRRKKRTCPNSGQMCSKESRRCLWQDDKRVQFLYQNATKEEYPSVMNMNLVRSPNKDRRKQVGSKTLKPWK